MKSSGTPNVSYRRKASSPATTPVPDAAPVEALLELRQARRQHRLEPVLLGLDHPHDVLALLAELGYAPPISRDEHVHEPVEERLGHARGACRAASRVA